MMTTTRRPLIAVALLFALILGFNTVAAPTPAIAAATDVSTILAKTNAARAANGLPALKQNAAMNAVADRWAKAMGAAQKMSHNLNYSKQIPKGWTRAGENVAAGYSSGNVVTAWMNSPGHRANILNKGYTDIGIGFFKDAKGRTWIVQNFAQYR